MVYPGVTEEVLKPIPEEESGLICGTDFKIGYSPERINPGDDAHSLAKITKIVAGIDAESADRLAGRAINDSMPGYVALMAIKGLNDVGKVIKGSKVLIDFFTKNRVKTALRVGFCSFLRPKAQQKGVTVFEC